MPYMVPKLFYSHPFYFFNWPSRHKLYQIHTLPLTDQKTNYVRYETYIHFFNEPASYMQLPTYGTTHISKLQQSLIRPDNRNNTVKQ